MDERAAGGEGHDQVLYSVPAAMFDLGPAMTVPDAGERKNIDIQC